jgi:hypothetical protein
MTASISENTIEKWKSILDPNGQLDHWAPISGSYACSIDPSIGTSSSFPSLLPLSMRIDSQTIGLNLVNVQPISGNSKEELERIKGEVMQENRDRAIDSVLDNKDFNPMKIEEHPDYNTGPKGQLFYMDFKYGGTSSNDI